MRQMYSLCFLQNVAAQQASLSKLYFQGKKKSAYLLNIRSLLRNNNTCTVLMFSFATFVEALTYISCLMWTKVQTSQPSSV